MNRIELATNSAGKEGAILSYLIAQTLLVSDLQAPVLEPFATGEKGRWMDGYAVKVGLQEADGTITYSGPGWIGNGWREVICRRNSLGYRIGISGIGSFSITSDGQRISQIDSSDTCSQAMLVEAALGPTLILALAIQERFCLHAGAVLFDEKLVAFVGESGYGKSTLAHYLGSKSPTRWRISDDILPLALGIDPLLALPFFPQLKLPADQQPPMRAPATVPMHTIYILDKNDSHAEMDVELQPMTMIEVMLALVQHTVAARLFDRELLAKHLEFCAEAASRVKARRLIYPRSFDMLPAVEEAILTDLYNRY